MFHSQLFISPIGQVYSNRTTELSSVVSSLIGILRGVKKAWCSETAQGVALARLLKTSSPSWALLILPHFASPLGFNFTCWKESTAKPPIGSVFNNWFYNSQMPFQQYPRDTALHCYNDTVAFCFPIGFGQFCTKNAIFTYTTKLARPVSCLAQTGFAALGKGVRDSSVNLPLLKPANFYD